MYCIIQQKYSESVNTDSKGNLTSLYFTADAMRSNSSDVEESLFQKQGYIVQILSQLFL